MQLFNERVATVGFVAYDLGYGPSCQDFSSQVLSLGILCRPLSCIIWDTAQKLFASQVEQRIDYKVVVGKGGMSLPCNALVDSGLCILSTREPCERGFVAYKNYPGGLHEERLANKGLMWAFWSTSLNGVLVVNTHLSSQREVRPKQLKELGDQLQAGKGTKFRWTALDAAHDMGST